MGNNMSAAENLPIIAIANQKGGVGKSTVATQAALCASQSLKLNVLFIDCDAQGNSSTRLMHDDLLETYSGTRTAHLWRSPGKMASVRPLRSPRGPDLIFALSGDQELYSKEASRMSTVLNFRDNLLHFLEEKQGGDNPYDLVIMDCPPKLGRELLAPLSVATDVFVPVEVAGFARDGLAGLYGTIDDVRAANPGLSLSGIIINKFNRRANIQVREIEKLQAMAGVGNKILDSMLPLRGAYDEANLDGKALWQLRTGAGKAAASEMKSVVIEMLRRCGAGHLVQSSAQTKGEK
jgi:chromosome partitioning protein